MGTKNDHGKFDCYDKAMIDEPMFVLLARDPHAPALVEAWSQHRHADVIAGTRPASDLEMVDEAVHCANRMRGWRTQNEGKWRHQDSEPLTPPMICKDGLAPAEYANAVLCFDKQRVVCVYCTIAALEPWPVVVTYGDMTFYPYGGLSAPFKYATRRGESVRTAV